MYPILYVTFQTGQLLEKNRSMPLKTRCTPFAVFGEVKPRSCIPHLTWYKPTEATNRPWTSSFTCLIYTSSALIEIKLVNCIWHAWKILIFLYSRDVSREWLSSLKVTLLYSIPFYLTINLICSLKLLIAPVSNYPQSNISRKKNE